MTKLLSPIFTNQQFDNSGLLLTGGQIFVYNSGTLVLSTIYSDSTGSSQSNPITLNSAGRIPTGSIYLDPNKAYDFELKQGTTVLESYQNIVGQFDYTNLTQKQIVKTSISSTQGQTQFTSINSFSTTLKNIIVSINGVTQIPDVDYQFLSSTLIEFDEGLNLGDKVLIQVLQ